MANPASNHLHWRPSHYYEQMDAITVAERNLKVSLGALFIIWALGAAVGGYLAGLQAFGSPVGGSALLIFDSAIMYVWSVRLINKSRKYISQLTVQNSLQDPLREIEEFSEKNPHANFHKLLGQKEYSDLLKIVKDRYSKEDSKNTLQRRGLVRSLVCRLPLDVRVTTLVELFPGQPPSKRHWYIEILVEQLGPLKDGKAHLVADKPAYRKFIEESPQSEADEVPPFISQSIDSGEAPALEL